VNPLPLVTIAIPTYNRADTYLPEALQSALRQGYPNIEILVSDNCSIDHTREYVTGIKDPRLRYFRHDANIGQRGNYDFCFQQARGDYVLLLHDDDRIDDDFVSSCIEAVDGDYEVGIIRTGVRIITASGDVVSQVSNEVAGLSVESFYRSWFAGRTAVYCCNTLFASQKLRRIGNFNSKHFCYPDTAAIFVLAAQHRRIDIGEVKASFRIHGGEEGFSRRIHEWCEDSLDLLKLMCGLAPHHKEQILKEGARFFARANYHRAASAATPLRRIMAILKVINFFGYRQLPSLGVVVQISYGTRLYSIARSVKRHLRNSSS
jgi:glycosyltransferase involved in cell wall biosynthesis